MMVDGDHSAEDGVAAAMLGPVCGVADHVCELPPVGVVAAEVPFHGVVRFVPELEVVKAVAVIGDDAVDEICVIAEPPGWGGACSSFGNTGRRVPDGQQDLESAVAEAAHLPVV